jgi:vancomycin permeability regulator SanA
MDNIMDDWKNDIIILQEKFMYKKKVYTVLENVFFVWLMLITSASEVIKFTGNDRVYINYTNIMTYLVVVSLGIKKYIDPETKKEKYKNAYIEAKSLEDVLESEVSSPSKELNIFLDELKKNKIEILKKYL